VHVLVAGGTEFISLHLVQALLREGHRASVLNRGRQPGRVPAGVRTLVADRKDHAALSKVLAGERFDALVDVTYAPTLGADVQALIDAPAAVGHVLFVSTGRASTITPGPSPSTRTPRATSTGASTRRTRSRARTSCWPATASAARR
jgi:nucleoside-diphosphate-sugar epimerase